MVFKCSTNTFESLSLTLIFKWIQKCKHVLHEWTKMHLVRIVTSRHQARASRKNLHPPSFSLVHWGGARSCDRATPPQPMARPARLTHCLAYWHHPHRLPPTTFCLVVVVVAAEPSLHHHAARQTLSPGRGRRQRRAAAESLARLEARASAGPESLVRGQEESGGGGGGGG